MEEIGRFDTDAVLVVRFDADQRHDIIGNAQGF